MQLGQMPQPIVAKVPGSCGGRCTRLRRGRRFRGLRRESSVFVLAHVNIGASPDGYQLVLPASRAGRPQGQELAILGQRLSAARGARRLGSSPGSCRMADLDSGGRDPGGPDRRRTGGRRSPREVPDGPVRLATHSSDSFSSRRNASANAAATDDFAEGVSRLRGKRKAAFNRAR